VIIPEEKENPTTSTFFDCIDTVTITDLHHESDWLRLGKMCINQSEVDCVFESNLDLLTQDDNTNGNPWVQAHSAPTLQGCTAMTIDTVFQGPSAFMSVIGNNNFPIIFDTGASLAISGNHDNFVGEIATPQNDL
jgi:hypothetical protein